MPSHVYLLTSRPYGTLYLGVTSNLGRRIVEHRRKAHPGFTATYGVDRLIWMENYERIGDAIAREKKIKKWRRDWKIALIEEMNPKWEDLFRGSTGRNGRHSGASGSENPEPVLFSVGR